MRTTSREKAERRASSSQNSRDASACHGAFTKNIPQAVLFDPYFQVRSDAAGVQGAKTDQKIVVALRQLTLDLPADAVFEYSMLSELTCAEALTRFVEQFA
jgi:hypothetical protein